MPVGRLVLTELRPMVPVGAQRSRGLIADVHPFAILFDHQAQFESALGGRVVIRAYPHSHGRLLELFSRNRLAVERCLEPTMGPGPRPRIVRACVPGIGWTVSRPQLGATCPSSWSGTPDVKAVADGTEGPASPARRIGMAGSVGPVNVVGRGHPFEKRNVVRRRER